MSFLLNGFSSSRIGRYDYPSPLKQRRYPCPWDIDMTLCIAAHCMMPNLTGEGRVVVAFDWQIEVEGTGSAEIQMKLEHLSERWIALHAGPVSESYELSRMYRSLLEKNEHAITPDDAMDWLRKPMREYRELLADRHTHATLAVSYREFLKNGSRFFPDDLRTQVAYDIARQQVEAELILIGQVGNYLLIAECVSGQVQFCQHFTAIGSGHAVAKASLYQRQQECTSSLADTIYSVYEAKRLGQNVPGVGKETSVLVIHATEAGFLSWDTLSLEDIQFESGLFKKFGPRNLKSIELPHTIAYSEAIRRYPKDTQSASPTGPLSPRSSKGDQLDQQPSPESRGASNES